jgi:hypothetical protein
MSVAQPLDSQGRSRGIAHETVIPHTNITDTGVPHDSLTDHIDQLTRERNARSPANKRTQRSTRLC